MRRLLRIRDARLFLAGWALSVFGDSAMFLVLGIWAKDLTGSNAAAGLVFFVLTVPSLAAPLAGLVVDRVPRRPLLIATNCLIGAAVLLLLLVHDRSDLWLIYLIAGLYGMAGSVLASARSALMTVMLPRELLADANAVFQTVREGLRLIAPLAGAGLYAAFGGGAVAVIDSATFLAAASSQALLGVRETKAERHEHRFLTELAAGARHVLRTVALRQIVLSAAIALLVIGFVETLIFAVIDQGLHRPTSFLGVIEPLQGAGSIAGGLAAAAMLRRLGDVRLVGLGLGLFALGDLSFVSSSLTLVLVGMTVAGVGLTWTIVGWATAVQLRTPAHLQGRVASAGETMVTLPQTASIAIGAALVAVVDYRILVVVVFAVTTAVAIYLLTRPPVRVEEEVEVAAAPAPTPEPAPAAAAPRS